MARITRKELKQDKFAAEVSHTVEYVAEHRTQLVRAGIAVAAVLVVAAGIYFYVRHQRTVREQALADAIRIQDTLVGPAGADVPTFPTQEAKDKEVSKAFNAVIDKYPGSNEAAVAHYFLGALAADQGKFSDAEKHLKVAVESASKAYASLAKMALAEVYFSTGRIGDGEKLLRDLMAHPTAFVSREEATIALARGLERTRPQEARKLLEPLRTSRTAISQVAIGALGEVER
jgi:predicted negative regulator of RcsB-dependent stress response